MCFESSRQVREWHAVQQGKIQMFGTRGDEKVFTDPWSKNENKEVSVTIFLSTWSLMKFNLSIAQPQGHSLLCPVSSSPTV
jgi:hypothetical protein